MIRDSVCFTLLFINFGQDASVGFLKDDIKFEHQKKEILIYSGNL